MFHDLEINGLRFVVETEPDPYHGAPWDEDDGHGPVSDWRQAENWRGRLMKSPGERVLCRDRGSARFYDVQAATRKAWAEGWGLSDSDREALGKRLGRTPTKGDEIHEAVERDFQYLRRFAEGDWGYVAVVVTLLDVDGDKTDESETMGGVESDSDIYIRDDIAPDLAREIAARIGRKRFLRTPARRIRVRVA